MKHYSKMWTKFEDNHITYVQAEKLLNVTNTSIVLSRLRKFGWLEISLDPEDSRKRFYKLKNPIQAVKEMSR